MSWTIDTFENLEPEKYYDNPNPNTFSSLSKKEEMLNNKDELYVATEKNDGCWAMLIHKNKNNNIIRSRSLSKITKKYGDFTQHLPQIVEEMNKFPDNTCLIGEICWNQRGKTSNDVDVILHCLPEKAVQRQENGKKLHSIIFDCLMLNGVSYENSGYADRLSLCQALVNTTDFKYIHCTKIFHNNFIQEAERIWDDGGEGIVIQLKTGKYAPGKRSAWKTLKYKQTIESLDLRVTRTFDANREYEGKELATWKYFDTDHTPVTKAFYNKWKTAIEVDFNGTLCKVSNGLTELDQQWLATDEAQQLINKEQLYAEIKAMMVNSKHSLRHPSVIRLRTDVDK